MIEVSFSLYIAVSLVISNNKIKKISQQLKTYSFINNTKRNLIVIIFLRQSFEIFIS